MYDEPFPIWYITLGLVIAGTMLMWGTIWPQLKLIREKLVHQRFIRARDVLEAEHAKELKAYQETTDFEHNAYVKRMLLQQMDVETAEERKEFDDRIYRSTVARDFVINQMKAEHGRQHRELELIFGY